MALGDIMVRWSKMQNGFRVRGAGGAGGAVAGSAVRRRRAAARVSFARARLLLCVHSRVVQWQDRRLWIC